MATNWTKIDSIIKTQQENMVANKVKPGKMFYLSVS